MSATIQKAGVPLAHDASNGRGEQALDEHLFATAHRARRYANAWGGEYAFTTGLWHDFGKYRRPYQTYLCQGGKRGSVTHSTAGALLILDKLRPHNRRPIDRVGRIPSAAIAMMSAILAHHGRLPDRNRLEERLGLNDPGAPFPGGTEYNEALAAGPPADILGHDMDWRAEFDPARARARHPLFARMMLSALVDADVIDSSGRKAARLKTMADLKASFDRFVATLGSNGPMDALRGEVLAACFAKASAPRATFRLDAPTGFGKTISGLGFALEHARLHGMDRVIYVAPFLTAIEQTATAIRRALNVEYELGNLKQFTVLEDHSTAERDAERAPGGSGILDDEDEGIAARDKLRENWEARIIVTSNVQFLESLHAHDRGRCRKLHRMANAVVLIDEPQTFPLSLFAPTVDTLQELVRSYGSSIVFVTATQPAFEIDNQFTQGFGHIEPILAPDLLDRLRAVAAARVHVVLPPGWQEVTIEQVADDVAREDRATLCIVNTRGAAASLFTAVRLRSGDATPLYHLSASMCSDHRRDILARIRAHLDAKEAVKVISTQVVEAGIDIDFPLVMRAMAGLDSLVQSAGRCNRHGGPNKGEFRVFKLEDGIPFMFRTAAAATEVLLRGGSTLFDPATASAFYRTIRDWTADKGEQLLQHQTDWNMTTVGTKYRLIEPTLTLVVPYGAPGRERVERLLAFARREPVGRDVPLFTGLSGITVSIREVARVALVEAGLAVEVGDFGLLVAVQDGDVPYNPEMGLVLPQADPVLADDAREAQAGAE